MLVYKKYSSKYKNDTISQRYLRIYENIPKYIMIVKEEEITKE